MEEPVRCIKLNIIGPEMPVIRPDDFLRTRMKSGSRFWLVIDAETVPQGRKKYPRMHINCYRVDRETWEKRDPDQATIWYHHNYRKHARNPQRPLP